MQRGGKGSRSKLYITLGVIGGLRPQIAHTFSAKLRAGAEAHFAGELRQRWEHAGAEKKTEATSHRRDAYGIPGIMVSADVESPPTPTRMLRSFTQETNHGTGND